MAQITRDIYPDTARKNNFRVILAKQFDDNSRYLRAVIQNEGRRVNISDKCAVMFNVKRADGKMRAILGSVNKDGSVLVPLTQWLLSVVGTAICSISIIEGEENKLTTMGFEVQVEQQEYIENGDITEDENYDILVDLIAEVTELKNDTTEATDSANLAAELANSAAGAANSAASLANEARENLEQVVERTETATESANKATQNANDSAEKADVSAKSADSAAGRANKAADEIAGAVENASEALKQATDAAKNAEKATTDAQAAVSAANEAIDKADTSSAAAEKATENANNAANKALDAVTSIESSVEKAEQAVKDAETATTTATEAAANAEKAVEAANTAKQEADAATKAANDAAETATSAGETATAAAGEANSAASAANESATKANEAAKSATKAAENVSAVIDGANTAAKSATDAAQEAKEAVSGITEAVENATTAAGTATSAAESCNTAAAKAEGAAEQCNTATEGANSAASAANEAAEKANTAAEKANVTVDDVKSDLADIQAYIGYTDSDILGVEVDFENNVFTRLAGAVGLQGGADFDKFNMYGGRKRCNAADNGAVNAYYGDETYEEDGSNGQVMVYQPKFYYKVVPLKLEPINGGEDGYSIKKARWYISDTPRAGFKLHPAFIENGNENDYILLSAYEGCVYDTDKTAYILDDGAGVDFNDDKLSSIANAKPASGITNALTRANTRKLANNRGKGWEQSYAATVAASQLLMLVEYASFNMQSNIGMGAVSKVDDSASSMTENTGGSASLGNASGAVNNSNNIQIVSYRGEENFWGNIWTWVDGMNEENPADWNSGQHGRLYVADHGFADDKGTDPYVDTGICPVYGVGYVSAIGYNEEFDWLFIPTEATGTSALPISDYYWNQNPGWRVAILGGDWRYGAYAGAFCWSLDVASSSRYRNVGGRLVYVPSKNI